jgi:hypothetical protein
VFLSCLSYHSAPLYRFYGNPTFEWQNIFRVWKAPSDLSEIHWGVQMPNLLLSTQCRGVLSCHRLFTDKPATSRLRNADNVRQWRKAPQRNMKMASSVLVAGHLLGKRGQIRPQIGLCEAVHVGLLGGGSKFQKKLYLSEQNNAFNDTLEDKIKLPSRFSNCIKTATINPGNGWLHCKKSGSIPRL